MCLVGGRVDGLVGGQGGGWIWVSGCVFGWVRGCDWAAGWVSPSVGVGG